MENGIVLGEKMRQIMKCVWSKSMCHKMYKCKNHASICIHLGKVCDKQYDCPDHDDEMYCELTSVQCFPSCDCLLFAITCVGLHPAILRAGKFTIFVSVYITQTQISSFQVLDHQLENAYSINLPRNPIRSVCPLHSLWNLLLLNLKINLITHVKTKCFTKAANLRSISLSHNQVMFLSKNAFFNLTSLNLLSLSGNYFTYIPEKCFSFIPYLKILNLMNITLKILELQSFFMSSVKVVANEDFKLSCVLLDATFCASYPPWYASCFNILPCKAIKTGFIFTSCLVLGLNALSIVILVVLKSNYNEAFKIKVIGLNMSDMLFGGYLIIIWLSDLMLQPLNSINQNIREYNLFCFLASIIVIWFNCSSQIMLIYLSVSRFKAVTDPIKTRVKSWNHSLYTVLGIHLLSLGLGISISLVFKNTGNKSPNTLCLPFFDPSGLYSITKILTWLVISSQFVLPIVILIIHIFVINQINTSKKKLTKVDSSRDIKTGLLWQLFTTPFCNFLCWFPANIVYMSTMFLSKYSINLIYFTTMIIMPVNSIINPCIITLIRFVKTSAHEK